MQLYKGYALKLLLRIASENNLKSAQVRKFFTRRLIQNIRAALTKHGIDASIDTVWGRVFLDSEDPAALDVLTHIFGINSVSPIDATCEPDLTQMCVRIAELYTEHVRGKTFMVRVARSDITTFTSVEAERALGAALFPVSAGVNLSKPEVKIHVEVRKQGAFFYTERHAGPCGFPIGVEGRGLALVSGGFDSIVAAWYLMKRGIEVDFLFCNLAGSAYERSVLRICKAFVDLWGYGYKPVCYVADFSSILGSIKTHKNNRYAQILLKRSMYRVASALAVKTRGQVLITGEAVGQVSSQTLHNLVAIDAASALPVLRPLIGFDKDEIVKKCREIGMHAWCASVREYCNITEKRPITHASVQDVDRAEELLPSLIDDVVGSVKAVPLLSLDLASLNAEHLFTEAIPHDAVLVDTREPYQFAAWHQKGSQNIPYEDLMVRYSKFSKERTYILCCPFGQQSVVAAEAMQNAGFEAYSYLGGIAALRRLETPS